MNIEIKNIKHSFNGHPVFNGESFCIPEKKITCIMGPSGRGKTTLLNVIMGLITPDSADITGLDDKIISACFQENRLCETFSAVKNIELVTSSKQNALIRTSLAGIGLGDSCDKPVSELSGGMKRRVAIMRALLADSNMIIMDEPFKGLDEELKINIINTVKSMTKDKTLIIVTHDLDEVRALGGELICM